MLDDFALLEVVFTECGLYEKWNLVAKWREATGVPDEEGGHDEGTDGRAGSSGDGVGAITDPGDVAELREGAERAEAAQEQEERAPVRQSMEHLEKAGKGKKGLAVCQQIVMSRPVRAMLIFLIGIISPVRREFGEAITSRKTKLSLREWLHKMCTGETANCVLKEICAVNYDNELAKRMGLSPNLGRNVSEFSLAEQGAIARDCESLTRSLLKREHEFFFFYQRMPFLRWAGLYHPDEKMVRHTLL